MKKTIAGLRTKLWRAKAAVKKVTITANKATANKVKDMNLLHSLIEKYLPTQTASFVKSQLKMHDTVSKQGYRWTLQDKLFGLSVFYHSRRAYSPLRKLFILPSKATLLKMLQQTNIYSGFNSQVFDALQHKVATLQPIDKQCVVVFDEMAIKTQLLYNKKGDCIEGFENL